MNDRRKTTDRRKNSKFQADTDDGDVLCNRGHVTSRALWNCPACTDAILDAVRRGYLDEAKSISDEIDQAVRNEQEERTWAKRE